MYITYRYNTDSHVVPVGLCGYFIDINWRQHSPDHYMIEATATAGFTAL
jgi:hypothetical protein